MGIERDEALERLNKIDQLFGEIESHFKVVMDIANFIREDEFLFLPKVIPSMYFAARLLLEGFNFRMLIETVVCYFMMRLLVNFLNTYLLDYITYNKELPVIRGHYQSIDKIFAEIEELNFIPKKYLVPFGVKKLINYFEHDRVNEVEEALALYDRDFSHRKYIRTKTQSSKKRIDDIYNGMKGFIEMDKEEQKKKIKIKRPKFLKKKE